MNQITNITSALSNAWVAGTAAFRASYLGTVTPQDYTKYIARIMRYKVLWAMYENTAYSQMHNWAQSYKSEFGLYRYIRAIYNPSHRLGEFWKSHLFAGSLDPAAGDGKAVPSAVPIITDNEKLRPAIATLWQNSNFSLWKDILSLRTSILGDGVLQVIDNPASGKVYIRYTNPSIFRDVLFDGFGNVKGYTIQELRDDPEKSNANATYMEIATRDGDSVVYRTYKNGKLYAWDGLSAEWDVPYGFIPVVWVQHNNVGMDFGQSELFAGLPKFRETDDIASKLSDQIRKLVDAPLFFSGVTQSDLTVTIPSNTVDSPDQGRQTVPAIYASDPSAKVSPMIADLKIGETSAYILDILKKIEDDYPELRTGIDSAGNDVSGRAIRLHRAPIEDKVYLRRVGYDDALMRIQAMAIAIGGWRGYDGFEGFDLDSWSSGDLKHSVGEHYVFRPDPMDHIDEERAFWEVAALAMKAKIPLPVFLEMQGWPKEKIDKIINSAEYQRGQKTADRLADLASAPPTFDKKGKNATNDLAGSS